jgi:hypothetical protein
VRASPLLEALLAPALLPRGWWNQRALLAIKEVGVSWKEAVWGEAAVFWVMCEAVQTDAVPLLVLRPTVRLRFAALQPCNVRLETLCASCISSTGLPCLHVCHPTLTARLGF